ncbi:secreted RxLR effector protein 161-like [Gossypium hirsutum]|uniref:Secreted RxLR effector protein 161-like n=1 Tax=Gossypium hirsutum TaxID=3635 RepID=A0ABM3BLN2_GOSHI|nr:secreted RxLR effector protein 161-like [Gossypium hirsutum]
MQNVFEMTDFREMTYFHGIEVNQSDHTIFISQQAFALKILNKFYMSNCKTVSTPVAQATRPDIMYAISLLSRFMHSCDVVHFKAAKRVLRYIKETLNYRVKFEKGKELKLIGYSNSDWTGSIDDMKSTSGYFFTLGLKFFC